MPPRAVEGDKVRQLIIGRRRPLPEFSLIFLSLLEYAARRWDEKFERRISYSVDVALPPCKYLKNRIIFSRIQAVSTRFLASTLTFSLELKVVFLDIRASKSVSLDIITVFLYPGGALNFEGLKFYDKAAKTL